MNENAVAGGNWRAGGSCGVQLCNIAALEIVVDMVVVLVLVVVERVDSERVVYVPFVEFEKGFAMAVVVVTADVVVVTGAAVVMNVGVDAAVAVVVDVAVAAVVVDVAVVVVTAFDEFELGVADDAAGEGWVQK